VTVAGHAPQTGRHIHVHRTTGDDQIVSITDQLPLTTISQSLSDAFTIYRGDVVEVSRSRDVPVGTEMPTVTATPVTGVPIQMTMQMWLDAPKGTTTLSALPPSIAARNPKKVGVRSPSTGKIMVLDVLPSIVPFGPLQFGGI